MSALVLERATSDLVAGDVIGYRLSGDTLHAATVVARDETAGGMHRLVVLVAMTGETRTTYCPGAVPWPVEQPPVYATVVVPRPVFGCTHANADDGCCNHPDWSSAECWVTGAGAPTDELLGHDERDGIHWAACPLVPYPDSQSRARP